MCKLSQSRHLIYLFVAGFLDINLLSAWAEIIQYVLSTEFKSFSTCLETLIVLYQQANMWFRRNVLVSRGSSDFFTLLLRAWRKHCNSRASIVSVKSGHDLGHILFSVNRLQFCQSDFSHSFINKTHPYGL